MKILKFFSSCFLCDFASGIGLPGKILQTDDFFDKLRAFRLCDADGKGFCCLLSAVFELRRVVAVEGREDVALLDGIADFFVQIRSCTRCVT